MFFLRITADQLSRGAGVKPEVYECVTLGFANVLHLFSICSKLKPITAVKVLDDIYCIVDDAISKFDAYKVGVCQIYADF